jgi:hypothetical protein
MKILLVIILILSTKIFAGTKEYIIGSGSSFNFRGADEQNINLSIYITSSSFTKLGVEYFFSTGSLIGIEAWQQYGMSVTDKGLTLDEGYIQSNDMKKPEIMTKDFLYNNDHGVKVDDFFFSKESEIEKYKIGLETIEVPAGTILANHYQKKRDEQIIDFWISDKAGAIGLVKLISKGTKDTNQNYTIELSTLLTRVKAKIDPVMAVPLSEKGKMFLGKRS